VQSKSSELISNKAIEIIQDVLGITLSPSQENLVIELEKNQDLFFESIYKIKEPRNEFTVALEAIYFLFFYDFDTKDIKDNVDKDLLISLKSYLSNSIDSSLIQMTEVVTHFLKYLDEKFQQSNDFNFI
jgi:hypothetical protein